MNLLPVKFGSTKNIPESEVKHALKGHSGDRPFSEPYEPLEEFDYMQIMRKKLKYPFSLNPAVIFPQDNSDPFDSWPQQNQRDKVGKDNWPLQIDNIPEFVPIINFPQQKVCQLQFNDGDYQEQG